MRTLEILQHGKWLLEFAGHLLSFLVKLLFLKFIFSNLRFHGLPFLIVFSLIFELFLSFTSQLFDKITDLGFVILTEVCKSCVGAWSSRFSLNRRSLIFIHRSFRHIIIFTSRVTNFCSFTLNFIFAHLSSTWGLLILIVCWIFPWALFHFYPFEVGLCFWILGDFGVDGLGRGADRCHWGLLGWSQNRRLLQIFRPFVNITPLLL